MSQTARKRLPIGIQTFSEIRQENHYYVDKTDQALQLIEEGKHYFLSRPRRFGKSLFIDTLKELFEGNEPLFKGLAAEKQWDWSVKYPVIRFSFGKGHFGAVEYLHKNVMAQLDQLDQQFDHHSPYDTAPERLASLLSHIRREHQQKVVVLIDEYDKPILDTLDNTDVARTNRDYLRGFYSTIKDSDADIKFSFLSGVSKFSRVSLFSGLNNLKDITLDPRHSTICGYTDLDIDSVFAPELFGLDRDKIRQWYNGYNWRGEGVYNPFDILQLFDYREFRSYWFESATPTFLVDMLFKRQVVTLNLDSLFSSSAMLSSFEVGQIDTEALLFQTGYLTIKKQERIGNQDFYTLGYPNLEVYQSLNDVLLSALVSDKSAQAMNTAQLHQYLLANDFEGLEKLFHRFYASIPHQWYTKNHIQEYEGYYASVFYSYFASLGLDVTVEDATNLGRIDMTLKFNQQIYIFEFKVVDDEAKGEALQQIKDKAYADKFRAPDRPIYLIGVEFSKKTRNVVSVEVEKA
ncbi:ATP-binding protein [Leucothrix mucor]|uniref:ATP-binding protein n=1 Tax=Leucothrix mucor TaxID=45248 RepID=UPI0003B7645C|nr:ATP-binding protein [Leucothrix mucor]